MKHLNKIDGHPIPHDPEEIRLVTVIKNERLRIPYMIEYYRGLGVDRFFIIDHFSNDGWQELVKDDPFVHIFQPKNQKAGFCKRGWKHEVMHEYCDGCWTLIIDPDELLVYPHCEKKSLRELCDFMEYENANVLRGSFLDVYSPGLLKDAVVKEGQNPLEVLTCFDNPPIKHYNFGKKPDHNWRKLENVPWISGGLLYRVANHVLCMNKVCLFKYDKTINVIAGHHFIVGRYIKSSSIISAVLHTKYSSDLNTFVSEDKVKRYYGGGEVYREYKKKGLGSDPFFTFETINSTLYKGSEQLLELDIIKSNFLFSCKGLFKLKKSQNLVAKETGETIELDLSNNPSKVNALVSYIKKEQPKVILDTDFKAGYASCLMLDATGEDAKLYTVAKNKDLEKTNHDIFKTIFPNSHVKLTDNITESLDSIANIPDEIDFTLFNSITNYENTIKLFEKIANKTKIGGIILVNNSQDENIKTFLNNRLLKGFSEIHLSVHGQYPLKAFKKVLDINLDFDIEKQLTALKIFNIGLSLSGDDIISSIFSDFNLDTTSFVDPKYFEKEIFTHQYIGDIPICNYFKEIDKKYNAKFIYTKKNLDQWLIDCEAHWATIHYIDESMKNIRQEVYGTVEFNKELFMKKYHDLDADIESYFKDKQDRLLILDFSQGEDINVIERIISLVGKENLPDTKKIIKKGLTFK